jgi:hypothetical protein
MAKSKRRNLKRTTRRRRRNQKIRGGAEDEKPKETSMFGSIFGDAEAKPEENAKEAPEKKEEDAPATEETPVVSEKQEEPPTAEVKKAEEPSTSIFGSVFGPANPEPPATSEEQPVAAVAAIPDGNRVTKRKRKRRTNKKGVARCTAYCRMQAKKRFCPKERMSTPYYQE